METIADWLAKTAASDLIQRVFWIIPVMQTIHILCVAMVFSSVVMIELRVLGATKSQTIEEVAHRYVPWIFGGVIVLAITGGILIIGEPKRSLPSYEFQMKMMYLAFALAFTVAFARSVHQHAAVWQATGMGGPQSGTRFANRSTLVNALALAALLSWAMVVVYGRWIAYTVMH